MQRQELAAPSPSEPKRDGRSFPTWSRVTTQHAMHRRGRVAWSSRECRRAPVRSQALAPFSPRRLWNSSPRPVLMRHGDAASSPSQSADLFSSAHAGQRAGLVESVNFGGTGQDQGGANGCGIEDAAQKHTRTLNPRAIGRIRERARALQGEGESGFSCVRFEHPRVKKIRRSMLCARCCVM